MPADSLLRMWWAEGHRWVLDNPRITPGEEAPPHATLHHQATIGLHDNASSPRPGGGGGAFGTTPWDLTVCLWRCQLASSDCSF